MMKRIAVIALSIILAGSTCILTYADNKGQAATQVSTAGTETSGDYQFRELNSDTVSVTGYTGSETNITIPEQIDGKSVTSIGEKAFFSNGTIESVTLPDTIETIEAGAFANCGNLTSITMTDSVKTLGDYVFARDKKLNTVTLSKSLTEIPKQTFYACSALLLIDIPSGVKSIGQAAFAECSALTALELPKDLEYLGAGVLSNSGTFTELTIRGKTLAENALSGLKAKKVTLDEGVETLQSNAFGMAFLDYVSFPASLKTIAEDAFSGSAINTIEVNADNPNYCSVNEGLYTKDKTKLIMHQRYCSEGATEVTFPDEITTIGSYAFKTFMGTQSGNQVACKVPDTVTEVDAYAFANASFSDLELPTGLKTIAAETFSGLTVNKLVIPEGVEKIESRALSLLGYSTESVSIPSTVTSIASDAFYGCENLKEIVVADGNSKFSSKSGALYDKEGKTLLAVPGGSSLNDNRTLTIPSGTETIGKTACAGYSNISKVVIPESVKTIEEKSFFACSELKTIVIPENVQEIGKEAMGYKSPINMTYDMSADGLCLIGQKNSAAYDYAKENSIAFYTGEPNRSPETVSMKTGETVQLDLTNMNVELCQFTSTDDSIIYVDEKGNVKAVSAGDTSVVVSCGYDYITYPIHVDGEDDTADGYVPLLNRYKEEYDFDPKAYTELTDDAVEAYGERYKELNSDHKFTVEENACINSYSSSEYKPILASQGDERRILQTESDPVFNQYEFFSDISDGLYRELSSYKSNENVILYRGIPEASEITGTGNSVADMKASIGELFIPKTNLSTSTSLGIAEGYAADSNNTGNAVLEIYAPADMVNGAYITAVSQFASEKEFLINQGARLLIMDAGVREVTDANGVKGTERYFKLLLVGNEVQKVNINLSIPEAGSKLSETAQISAVGVKETSAKISWTLDGKAVSDGSKAEKASEYTTEITLTPAQYYQFSDASSVYVNGEECELTVNKDGSAVVKVICKTK